MKPTATKTFLAQLLLVRKNLRTRLNTFIARHTCRTWGVHSVVAGSAVLEDPWNISVGNGTIINEGAYLNAYDTITIGNHVHISSFCIINTGTLDDKEGSERNHAGSTVVIEDGAWLASGVIVNPGVKIGAHAVIGAGSVVTKDIPAYSIAVGSPARVIGDRNPSSSQGSQ